MMTQWHRMALLTFLVTSIIQLSCDDQGDNYIDGSLVKNYNISFKNVEAVLVDSGLSIKYNNKKGVAALVVSIKTNSGETSNGIILAKGKTYILEKYGSVTGFELDLPEIEKGKLTLEEYAKKEGALVQGEFNAKFLPKEDEGSQTLRGAFKTKLKIEISEN